MIDISYREADVYLAVATRPDIAYTVTRYHSFWTNQDRNIGQ